MKRIFRIVVISRFIVLDIRARRDGNEYAMLIKTNAAVPLLDDYGCYNWRRLKYARSP